MLQKKKKELLALLTAIFITWAKYRTLPLFFTYSCNIWALTWVNRCLYNYVHKPFHQKSFYLYRWKKTCTSDDNNWGYVYKRTTRKLTVLLLHTGGVKTIMMGEFREKGKKLWYIISQISSHFCGAIFLIDCWATVT